MGLQGRVQCVGLLVGVNTRSVGWWRSSDGGGHPIVEVSAVAREAHFFVEFYLKVMAEMKCSRKKYMERRFHMKGPTHYHAKLGTG